MNTEQEKLFDPRGGQNSKVMPSNLSSSLCDIDFVLLTPIVDCCMDQLSRLASKSVHSKYRVNKFSNRQVNRQVQNIMPQA